MSKKMVEALFDDWNKALISGEPAQIADLYHPEAILIPTMSNTVRHNHEEIQDYFSFFMKNKPQSKLIESNIRIYDCIAFNSGVYNFSFDDGRSVNVRFSFVYKNTDDKWLIVEHHSSFFPEQ